MNKHVIGDGHAPVAGLTIPEVLSQTAHQFPDHESVVFPKLLLRWSYEEFVSHVDQVARALLSLGISPGEHVGIWCTNRPEWLLAQFATASIGAVLVNVNPAYRLHEVSYVIEQSDLVCLLTSDSFKSSDYEGMLAELIPELSQYSYGDRMICHRFPKLRQVVSVTARPSVAGIWPWPAFLDRARETSLLDYRHIRSQVRPNDPVNMQYTSGTTGSPKGAMLSHQNLLHNAYYVGTRMRFSHHDRLAIPVPFYHCFGCVMGTLMCVVHGATMVIPAESFEPEATLHAVDQERCTGLFGVPTMFNAEIHSPSFHQFNLTSLRTGIMAGSPCPIELMKQVTEKMHLQQLTIAYGLTESSPVITQTETAEPIEIRVSTVGKPLPGVEVKLVDPDTGKEMTGIGQGELWSRGHGTMIGYYKKEKETSQAIDPDGWLRTGDLAVLTETGHYKITGRIKDVIIRGGENIYPREIEEYLMTLPEIKDVQIVGLPDAKFGEAVSAWIILHVPGTLTEDDVRKLCRANLAHYKVPTYVEFLAEYPTTVTGKVQKFKLREEGIKRFHLQSASQIETA